MDFTLAATIAFISFLAAVSPGPDFAIVVKNCLSGKFKAGFLTSLGVAAALFVHISYCILGIAVLIVESPLVFHGLKYLGAIYLFYLGVQLLREKGKAGPEGVAQKGSRDKNAFISGFLCNLLNPKATFFVLSLFTQFIHPAMGFMQKISLASILPLVVFAWFVFLSCLITHRKFQKQFSQFQSIIVKVMGVVLCGLSLYITLIR